jgi:organic hydroperoxide reductase OsmC/OhrA
MTTGPSPDTPLTGTDTDVGTDTDADTGTGTGTGTDALYTARVRNRGGTSGQVLVEGAAAVELGAMPAGPDGALALPTGGPTAGATGFNPEQLLAMAWSTCLGETLRVVLAEHGHALASRVDVEVELHRDPAGGYRFVPRALVEIDDLPAAEARTLIEAAHARCPVSKLLTGRGEASVTHRIPH